MAMKRAAYLLTLILACGAASGCGTLFNLAGEEVWVIALPQPRETVPFGGVDNDVRWMERGIPPNRWGNEWMPGCIAVAAADMPLSLAGDIVTLPWTVPYWILNRLATAHDSLPDPDGAPAAPAPN
jgi:hypothetical protein